MRTNGRGPAPHVFLRSEGYPHCSRCGRAKNDLIHSDLARVQPEDNATSDATFTCKYCGADGLYWGQHATKDGVLNRRLFEGTTTRLHTCVHNIHRRSQTEGFVDQELPPLLEKP